jgi:hypothetical protein
MHGTEEMKSSTFSLPQISMSLLNICASLSFVYRSIAQRDWIASEKHKGSCHRKIFKKNTINGKFQILAMEIVWILIENIMEIQFS